MRKALFAILCILTASAAAAAGQSGTDYTQPDALEKLVAGRGNPPSILVDVRTPEEYEFGHIPTAINIPVSEIGNRPPTQDRKALIVVYCRSGSRSATAARILRDLGYGNVVDFGAVSRWEKPLVEGSEPGEP
jgi:rhodanese-related sulfurtransferase